MLHTCWPFPGANPQLRALAAAFPPGRVPPFLSDPRTGLHPGLPMDWRMAAAAAQEHWALHQAAVQAAQAQAAQHAAQHQASQNSASQNGGTSSRTSSNGSLSRCSNPVDGTSSSQEPTTPHTPQLPIHPLPLPALPGGQLPPPGAGGPPPHIHLPHHHPFHYGLRALTEHQAHNMMNIHNHHHHNNHNSHNHPPNGQQPSQPTSPHDLNSPTQVWRPF